MDARMIGMLAETNLHFGAGRSEGIIDLPVAREASTGYPVLVGSSLKGAMRDAAGRLWKDEGQVKKVFGSPNGMGGVSTGDARLVLLPVRSLEEAYKWLTCPYILERLVRDMGRCNIDVELPKLKIASGQCLGKGGKDEVFLEERQFSRTGTAPPAVIEALFRLFPSKLPADRLADQLLILNNDDFVWFANYGLAVRAHNALDKDTKTVKGTALWYEESLPSDTLLTAVISGRDKQGQDQAISVVDDAYLQAGANETTGMGWMKCKEVR